LLLANWKRRRSGAYRFFYSIGFFYPIHPCDHITSAVTSFEEPLIAGRGEERREGKKYTVHGGKGKRKKEKDTAKHQAEGRSVSWWS